MIMIPIDTYIEYKYSDIINQLADFFNWESVNLKGGHEKCEFTHEVTFGVVTDNAPNEFYTGENGFVYFFDNELERSSIIGKEEILEQSTPYHYNGMTVWRIPMNVVIRFLMGIGFLPKESLIVTNRKKIWKL